MGVDPCFGDGPNTVSESTVSNTELSEFSPELTEFRGPNSVSSFRPIICVQTGTHRVSRSKLTEFAAELSEFSLPIESRRS